jgi:hypothetical protein
MPLNLIMHNPRAGLIFSNFISAVVTNAVIFNVPLYFQAVLLESATNSGLRLVVPSIAASAVGTATGFLITWTKRMKWLLVCGVVLYLIGTVALSGMQRGMPDWAYLLFLVPSAMGQGFLFPTTFMAVLAVSEQSEQAVVTSTLILWRSLGTVLGVAVSSLVLQNALVIYLEEMVTGPDRENVWHSLLCTTSVSKFSKLTETNRLGYFRSPQISACNSRPGTALQRTSHRRVRSFIESHVHHGCHLIRGCDFYYVADSVAQIGAEKEVRTTALRLPFHI